MNYQCDEEGLFCSECGLNPHFCRCQQIEAIVHQYYYLMGDNKTGIQRLDPDIESEIKGRG